MKIFKVRALDVLGKEVAEFGFYESKADAERRRVEVVNMVTKYPGTIDIREITVIEDSEKVSSIEELNYYELK